MRIISIFIFFTCFSLLGIGTATGNETCEVVKDAPEIQYGTGQKLSDFWAYEVSGIDLVEEERAASIHLLRPTPTYVCDSTFEDHYIKVRAVVDGMLNILPSVGVCHRDGGKDVLEFSNTLANQEVNSSIVNLSLGLESSFPNLQRSILVIASGNDWNEGEPELSIYNELFMSRDKSIFVGAMGPDGFATTYSQEGEKISILAAVGEQELTSCHVKPCISLSGTSFAAPQVTYIFKAIRELLPSISKTQLIKILEKSAIQTFHSIYESPKMNGAGLLNAYKMWKIAKRIYDSCGKSNSACNDRVLNDNLTYVFPVETYNSNLFASNFPECGSQIFSGMSCGDKKTAFHKLRKNFLLSPNNDYYRKSLQCAYKQIGYTLNAVLYENLSPKLNPAATPRFTNNPKTLRFMSRDQQNRFLETGFYSGAQQVEALTQLSLMGSRGIELLINYNHVFSWDSPNFIRLKPSSITLLDMGKRIGRKVAIERTSHIEAMLELISRNQEIAILYPEIYFGIASKLPSHYTNRIFGIFINSSAYQVRRKTYRSIFRILQNGHDESLHTMLRNGLNDPSNDLRQLVQEYLGLLNQ